MKLKNLSRKILTIAIPTWNRARYLKGLIDQLVVQINTFKLEQSIEILISDNASDDNTRQVVDDFIKNSSYIVYSRNEKNIGAKSNVLKSMEIASGEYVLLIGDDDRIRNNCLVDILKILIESKPGVLIDISGFRLKLHEKRSEIPLNELVRNYYWLMGNAGHYVVKTEYVKSNLKIFGYDYFNECWPHTQIIILGISQSKELCIVDNLTIPETGFHAELMVYSSFYLLRTCYFELLNSINDIKNNISEDIYKAARLYMVKSLPQQLLNILQCGIFVDDAKQKQQTRTHIINNISKFTLKEQLYLLIIYFGLALPGFISKPLSNLFIFLLKGAPGLEKKNEFVKTELQKKISESKPQTRDVRRLEFEK